MKRLEFIKTIWIAWVWIFFWSKLVWKSLVENLSHCSHEEALKNISWDSKKWAKLEIYDSSWIVRSILFSREWVSCNWKLFKPRFWWIWLTIKDISYKQNKFIIKWKLWILSKQVQMPLENACQLVEQILNLSYSRSKNTEILIPEWSWAKLILEK